MSFKITWFSHACVMFDVDGTNILVDPFLTGNPLAPVSQKDLNSDYIFISHGHEDHLGDTVKTEKRLNAVVVSNPEICSWLENFGITNLQHLQIGGAYKFPWGKVKMTYATHSSSMPDGAYGGNPAGFIFYINNKKIYHACDTGLFSDMKLIGEEGIDLAFLPIGDCYTMGPKDALRAIKMIKPKQVVPIHYNTFDLIKQNPDEWAEIVEKETDTKVLVMKPGDSIEL